MKKFSLILSLLFFVLGTTLAQRTVSGTVTDAEGEALIGASILVKGTAVGTTTDIDGKYELRLPEGQNTIIVSYTGYETQELTFGASNIMDVKMVAGVTLSDVVVTALGVSREKKTLGYAVQEIGGEEVNEVRETNIVSSLSGKVAGVNVRMPNTMGGSANILIRGVASLTENNQPLFVIDGVPIDNNNTNQDRYTANGGRSSGRSDYQNDGWGGYDYGNAAMDLNPDDVESISVLKGAAASALYGSRAANGVVLITTKKGNKQKGIGVTINSGYTASVIDKTTMPQHQDQYGGGYGAFYENEDVPGVPDYAFFYGDVDGDGTDDLIVPTSEDASWGARFDPSLMVVHWDALDPAASNYGEKRPWVAGEHGIDYFFRTGKKWTNNVAIDGGNDKGTFRLSFTNVDEDGILPNSSIKRNTINFAAGYNFSEKLTLNANATFVKSDAVGRYGTGYDGWNVMQSFGQWFERNVDLKRLEEKYLRPDGSQLSWNHGYWTSFFPDGTRDPNGTDHLKPIYFDNPYWVRNKNFQDDTRNRLFGYASLEYQLTDWLEIMGRVALDDYTESQNERIAIGSVDPSYFSNFSRSFQEVNVDLNLKFNKTLGDISLTGLIGGNYRENTLESVLGETVGGLIVPDLYTISNSVSPVAIDEELQRKNVNSVYGTASIGYKGTVYLELTDRYDASSTLPKGNRGYNYYGVSTSLIISELGNLGNQNWLSFAKLRASYAEVGNDAPIYSTRSTYSQNTNWGDQALFSVNSTLQNPELKPERTKSYEVGLEARLFNSRLNFDVAGYITTSEDQILPVLVSPTTGFTRKYVNAGEIENKGVELAASVVPLKLNSGLTWDIGINWYLNRNKVVKLFDEVENLLIYSAWDASVNASIGEAYGTIKGSNFVYTNGQPTIDSDPESSTFGLYLKEKDEEGNEIEDAIIGDINPDWNMGISSSASFKGLSLRVLFDIQKGGDIYSINTKYGQATGLYEETAGTNPLGNPQRDNLIQSDGTDLGQPSAGLLMSDAANNSGGYVLPGVKEDGSPNDILFAAGRWGRAFYYTNSPTARYVFDASYVKLREVALSYTLPGSVVDNTPLTNITISLIGRNLAILHKNTKHFDPETSLSSGNQQGIETGSYPTTRTFGVNVRLGF